MKLTLALLFGGKSTEHEVSVITALQAYENLNKEKYDILPIYQSKKGDFYTNNKFLEIKNYKDIEKLFLSSKKVTFGTSNENKGVWILGLFNKFTSIDVVLPLFHGSFGEDGCLQGIFETLQIPYAGFNVMGSAVAMDKVISKAVFQNLGLNVGKYISILRNDWNQDSKKCLAKIKENVSFPVFVKPADIGSTIGINKANDEDELSFNIEVAGAYSDKILIEEAFEDCVEVNCAALGYSEITPSLCEMPIRSGNTLSYDDKYMSEGKGSKGSKSMGINSLNRKIPAPISKKLTQEIQDATIKVFKELEGCGVARIDYFVDPKTEKFWINEVNSPPGSLAFYLYKPMGISYEEILDTLISCALERFENQKKTQFTFDSPLLSQMAQKGEIKN